MLEYYLKFIFVVLICFLPFCIYMELVYGSDPQPRPVRATTLDTAYTKEDKKQSDQHIHAGARVTHATFHATNLDTLRIHVYQHRDCNIHYRSPQKPEDTSPAQYMSYHPAFDFWNERP
jgi:hypothetical protein